MTKVQQVLCNLPQTQDYSVQKGQSNLYRVNFKNNGNDQFVRNSQRNQITTDPFEDRNAAIQKAIEKQQRQQKNKNIMSYITGGLGIALTAVMLVFFGKALMGKGAGNAASELKELTDVPIKWTRFEGEDKVASLTSKTTAPIVRKQLGKLVSLSKLSEHKKLWAGVKNRSRIYYMYGESAVGKTYAVKQFAQEMGAEYTCIKYGNLGSPFKDAGSMKILNMFKNIAEEANKNPNKKYVVCIDEIDALLRKVSEMDGKEASNARSSVLTGIDELVAKCNNVTVVATSNYHPGSKMLDQASMRRFNAKILVPLPNEEQTCELLKMYLKGPQAIKDEFYSSEEFSAFVKDLVKNKYANGEIETIANTARDNFGESLISVAEENVEKTLFNIDFLKEAKELYGDAAALTNDTMIAGLR